MRAATTSSADSPLAFKTTAAPSALNKSAAARPIPDDAPVMMATLSCSKPMMRLRYEWRSVILQGVHEGGYPVLAARFVRTNGARLQCWRKPMAIPIRRVSPSIHVLSLSQIPTRSESVRRAGIAGAIAAHRARGAHGDSPPMAGFGYLVRPGPRPLERRRSAAV